MDIFHATWLTPSKAGFNNDGQFVFWIETPQQSKYKLTTKQHPYHLSSSAALDHFLSRDLSLSKALISKLNPHVVSIYISLPSAKNKPLASLGGECACN